MQEIDPIQSEYLNYAGRDDVLGGAGNPIALEAHADALVDSINEISVLAA